ncbi:hypothetical protein [Mycolicibacterium obuense]|nr:hypothetical protein [Mycolicibacterium obuense]
MTAPITVDPVALAGMGAAVATDGVTVAAAAHMLSTTLSGAGALFGHDAAGALFGQSYTQAGKSLLDAAASAVNACRKVGFGVQMSAFNYGRANAASTVGGGETPVPQPSAPGAFTAPSMPPPMGSGVVAPLLWTVVESLVGDVWPDGNPEEMRAAAAAWRSFGAAVGTTAEPVTAVSAALAGQQIPEAGHMGDAAGQISSGLADVAAQAQELASHVEAFATNVEATQNAIRGLLHQLSISGVLDALGDIFSGENPWQKVQEVADEIKTVLGNMKRQADASRTLFSQSMNALDSATTSLQSWATKEFVEVFGEDVGTALSQDFKALTSLPAGGLKFLGVTAEGLQGLDPMRFAYDPQGAVDTWKSLADSTAMLTNPALLAEKVISDPQGSLDAAKAMVDWEDVEKGDPFRALGYNAAQVGTMFLPGAGEAGPAAGAASAEARVAGAEARAAGAGTRDAAAAAGGRAASATDGISTKASEVGSKLDDIKVPEAQPGSSVGGKAPVEASRVEPTHESRAPRSESPIRQEPNVRLDTSDPHSTKASVESHLSEAHKTAEHEYSARPGVTGHSTAPELPRSATAESSVVPENRDHGITSESLGAHPTSGNSTHAPGSQSPEHAATERPVFGGNAAQHDPAYTTDRDAAVDQRASDSGHSPHSSTHHDGGTNREVAGDGDAQHQSANEHPGGLTDEKRDEILALEKGARPDPSEYLSREYIEEHLRKFADGATRFMPESNFTRFGISQVDGTSFVMTSHDADALLQATGGDPRAIERSLGLPTGFLDDNELVRIDVPRPDHYNLRIPSGNEAGANSEWIPGGLLPDGLPEAVIDGRDVPPGDYHVSEIDGREP